MTPSFQPQQSEELGSFNNSGYEHRAKWDIGKGLWNLPLWLRKARRQGVWQEFLHGDPERLLCEAVKMKDRLC